MTAIANITVKKNDGVTNIVWTALKGSGGDGDPAVWRSDTATGYVGQKPTFSLSAKTSGSGEVRRLDFKGVYPSVYTDSTTSVTSKLGQFVLTGSLALPQGLPATDLNEACAQFVHMLNDASVIAALQAGFAPT